MKFLIVLKLNVYLCKHRVPRGNVYNIKCIEHDQLSNRQMLGSDNNAEAS